MNRREFMHLSSVGTALAAAGRLPLLAADGAPAKPRRPARAQAAAGPGNTFAGPPAIEPVTGYLRKFTPVANGSMRDAFSATYTLVQSLGSGAVSRNGIAGALAVSFTDGICTSREARKNRPANVVETRLCCGGDRNAARKWTLTSSVEGAPDLAFTETGACDGKTLTVKAKSWTRTRDVSRPVVGRWALVPLLAAGKLKAEALRFDMLDNSTLRADQTLRYVGKVHVRVAGGAVKLDCYAQTGRSVLPIHYLVDDGGRVQLMTEETVNWALTALK